MRKYSRFITMADSYNHIKSDLFRKLQDQNAFWSCSKPEPADLSDSDLIENVIVHLDKREIKLLFQLFPKYYIQKVWRERLVSQEPYYHSLNKYMAYIFFGIKNPDKYLKRYSVS
jgi:hypothetical protein